MAQPVVDSHVHFWDPHHLHYPWLAEVPQINKPFLVADFNEASAGLGIEKIVFVQADCVVEDGLREVDWVAELAREDPRIQGIVAFAPLEQGQAAQDYLAQLAGNKLVKGVRRLIQSEGSGFSTQPDFVRGVRLVTAFDFSFDICIKHDQLADVLNLVGQCPDVSFVLDHIGKPDIKSRLFDPWRAEIEALAEFPNVSCKISGMVTEADLENWTRDDLKPYIDHVVETFGPERIMYGGDWPVSTLAATYAGWFETLSWATMHLSEADRHKLFFQNAASFYKLEA